MVLVPALMPTFLCIVGRELGDFKGGTFDPLGTGWIVVVRIVNGFILGTMGLMAAGAFRARAGLSLTTIYQAEICMLCFILFMNLKPGATERDKWISRAGYLITESSIPVEGAFKDAPVPSGYTTVMKPKQRIVASTEIGKLIVSSGNGLLRTFEWKGGKRSIDLIPIKDHKLQYPNPEVPRNWPGFDWKELDGTNRCTVFESQANYHSKAEAIDWLQKYTQGPPSMFSYRNDGLIIGCTKSIGKKQLTIFIIQLLIDGQKPSSLPGANDKDVVVANSSESSR